MGLRGANQSKSRGGGFARLQDRHVRAARSGLFELAPRVAVRSSWNPRRFSPMLVAPATRMQADQASLEKRRTCSSRLRSPLIATKYLGRNPEAVAHSVELAELLSIPVVQQLNHVNFPTDHPLYVGYQTTQARQERRRFVLYRHRCAMGAAESAVRSQVRRQDHPPGARPVIHCYSWVGFSGGLSFDGLF